MTNIKAVVTGAKIALELEGTLTAGMVGVPVTFSFDESWEGLSKTAVFRAGGLTMDVIGVEAAAIIPWEVLNKPHCTLYVGVHGVDAEGSVVIPTLWESAGVIQPGADPNQDSTVNPSLPVWEQVIQVSAKTAQAMADKAASEVLPPCTATDCSKVLSHGENGCEWVDPPYKPNGSAAFGNGTAASGKYAFAEGYNTKATGLESHAEGYNTKATSTSAHAEGYYTTASSTSAHAEGYESKATGETSHAEGHNALVAGAVSHGEGYDTKCYGGRSHVEGVGTICTAGSQHVGGRYNLPDPRFNDEYSDGSYPTRTSQGTYQTIIGGGTGKSVRTNIHTLDWSGNAVYAGSVGSNGADYAEYFEWADGNPDGEDRVGRMVTLDGEKIRFATTGDDVLGIVSGTAAVLGDNAEWEWKKKYVTDDFGRIVYEMVEEFEEVKDEETGEVTTRSVGLFSCPKINPEYDGNKDYTPRSKRPEWSAVGMFGKLYVRDDGSCKVNGYVSAGADGIATASVERTNMQVLARTSENLIRVMMK